MTGTQLAAEVEQHLPGLRVLFTTGYSAVPALKLARKGVSLLRKPYKTRDLALTVRQALEAAYHGAAVPQPRAGRGVLKAYGLDPPNHFG